MLTKNFLIVYSSSILRAKLVYSFNESRMLKKNKKNIVKKINCKRPFKCLKRIYI